jgi:hypothetical protein
MKYYSYVQEAESNFDVSTGILKENPFGYL